jgi:hypothetical protein
MFTDKKEKTPSEILYLKPGQHKECVYRLGTECTSIRRRWEDSIKMDLREIGIDGTNGFQLAQDRVQWRAFVNTVMNLRFP